jgi:serine/threonine-protein kinase RsbW
MSVWWSLHLRREAASVPFARRLLLGTMETAGVDPDISFELSIALSEACANAVEHGGDEDDGGGYRVTAFIDGDHCRIEVTDSGPGLVNKQSGERQSGGKQPGGKRLGEREPGGHRSGERQSGERAEWRPEPRPQRAQRPAPAHAEHGRGLFLIEALTDHVRYRARPGREGTVVSFDKILKWRDDALLKAS